MDYKYIENLIERYFDCLTSIEEERILKAFFLQEEVPAQLKKYAPLFTFEAASKEDVLDDDFDQRLEQRLEKDGDAPVKRVHIKRLTLTDRIRPLIHAAAAVAIVALVGNSIHTAYLTGTYTTVGTEKEDGMEAEVTTPEQYNTGIPDKCVQEKEKMAFKPDSLNAERQVD